jgi:hypothetical protein
MDRARACGLDLLRKVVDQHTLDQALSETGTINADIRKILLNVASGKTTRSCLPPFASEVGGIAERSRSMNLFSAITSPLTGRDHEAKEAERAEWRLLRAVVGDSASPTVVLSSVCGARAPKDRRTPVGLALIDVIQAPSRQPCRHGRKYHIG